MTNYLCFGDNLDVFRESIGTESVDLVYLDSPFDSNRSYKVLFTQRSGRLHKRVLRRSMPSGRGRTTPNSSTGSSCPARIRESRLRFGRTWCEHHLAQRGVAQGLGCP